jgi:hypothetical protein
MNYNFYTTFENTELIKKGQKSEVWIESQSSTFDIHVAFSDDMYSIKKISSYVYSVEKKEQKENETLVDVTSPNDVETYWKTGGDKHGTYRAFWKMLCYSKTDEPVNGAKIPIEYKEFVGLQNDYS